MFPDSDRSDRFGQALFDALVEGFDHAWTTVDFDEEPTPEAETIPAAGSRSCPDRSARQ
jgi:hypothetical protein